MKQYLELLKKVKKEGVYKSDRTGTGTYSIFGAQLRFNLQEGLPLMTTKKVHLRSVIHELLWFVSGDTNAKYLQDNDVTIWDEWVDEKGDLGEIYGFQWRNFAGEFDQLRWLIEEAKNNPSSRRLYVTSANPLSRYKQALDCCHNYFQIYINEGKLSLYFQMRSTDIFLGLPFNIASYAILAHLLAKELDYEVGELVYSGVDVHLYSNHLEQAELQLSRELKELPSIWINPEVKSIFDFKYEDIKVLDYNHHPSIKAKVAV